MKYLICSDTHGRLKSFNLLKEAIDSEKPDFIIHLGDFLYNGPRNGVPDDYDPMALGEYFASLGDRLIGVYGNCDSRIDKMVIGKDLQDFVDLDCFGRTVHLNHGDALEEVAAKAKPGDLIFYGHTHLYELEKRDGIVFLNPGSIGFPKGGNPATYAIFEDGVISIKELSGGETLTSLDVNV